MAIERIRSSCLRGSSVAPFARAEHPLLLHHCLAVGRASGPGSGSEKVKLLLLLSRESGEHLQPFPSPDGPAAVGRSREARVSGVKKEQGGGRRKKFRVFSCPSVRLKGIEGRQTRRSRGGQRGIAGTNRGTDLLPFYEGRVHHTLSD